MGNRAFVFLAAAISMVSYGASIAIDAPEGIAISTRLLRWQKSCPAQVIALNKAKAGWFINDVLVLNAGSIDIQEVQLGLVLSEPDNPVAPSKVLKKFDGYRIPVAIAPGKAAALGPQPWTVGGIKNELKTFGSGNYLFTVGILSVLLADGKMLTFDPESDFIESRMTDADEAFKNLDWAVVEAFAKAAHARAVQMYERSRAVYTTSPMSVTPLTENGNGGYFKCADTMQPIYCTNHVTSCTETECGAGKPCPHQKCEYYY